jgi:DNA polymerase-3 subunit beta
MVANSTELEGVASTYKALLPRKAMSEILKLANEAEPDAKLKFAGDDNHLFFELGERLLISRKLTGNFPDFERVLPKEHGQSVTLSRDELRSAIERVSQFSDERSRAIRLQFTKGEVKVYSSLSETGESEETLSSDYAGPDMEIGFNAQYMVDFLRAVPESAVEFLFRDPNSAGEMRPSLDPESKYNYRYVIMPMRI